MQKTTPKRFDIQNLAQLRDELKVQAHLFKAEAQDEWQRLEQNWEKLRSQAGPVRQAAERSVSDVERASKVLFETIKQGYERIKRSLPS